MKLQRIGKTRNGGFSLLELTVAMAGLSIVLMMLYGISFSMVRAAKVQDSVIMLKQESRLAMQSIVQNLRMSQSLGLQVSDGAGGFVPLGAGQFNTLQFRRAADIDANNVALNQDLTLGLSQQFLYTVDTNDANGDGQTVTQLVRLNQDGTVGQVLANHVAPVMARPDVYNAPQGGLIFQNVGGGNVQVTLIMRHQPDPAGPAVVSRLDEIVSPRN